MLTINNKNRLTWNYRTGQFWLLWVKLDYKATKQQQIGLGLKSLNKFLETTLLKPLEIKDVDIHQKP